MQPLIASYGGRSLSDISDVVVESIFHGVILLSQVALGYGPSRRNVMVLKVRAVNYRSGFHDLNIETGGIVVYPRLVDIEHRADFKRELLVIASLARRSGA